MKKNTLTERIEELLAERGWTVADLARQSGRKYHEIHPWWRNPNSTPSAPALLAVARALQVTPEYLLTGERDPVIEDRKKAFLERLHYVQDDQLPLLEAYLDFLLSREGSNQKDEGRGSE